MVTSLLLAAIDVRIYPLLGSCCYRLLEPDTLSECSATLLCKSADEEAVVKAMIVHPRASGH